ncbi:hypothetical protein HMPREF9623_01978 [Stomatobaculum longum]|uniref:Uncharacterized protein n=1 Tax=Stomatobaculum longum TaxID=796942 RepID=A0AA37DFD0_9FIRM|nr:hypothetical protein HMPREF9623_01978 [Stomatobaculum longum]
MTFILGVCSCDAIILFRSKPLANCFFQNHVAEKARQIAACAEVFPQLLYLNIVAITPKKLIKTHLQKCRSPLCNNLLTLKHLSGYFCSNAIIATTDITYFPLEDLHVFKLIYKRNKKPAIGFFQLKFNSILATLQIILRFSKFDCHSNLEKPYQT